MNPTAAQSLDPKLKEVYDRVMGTPTSATSNPKAQPPTPPTHVPVEGMPAQPKSPQVEQVTVVKTSAPSAPSHDHEEKVEMVNINTTPTSTVVTKTVSSKKISPVIFVVLGVSFFIGYTVLWLKVFSVF